ncbi:MAG: hypothetical protein FJ098_15600, partial [Deltaproteobacteria bacterium]|nr:hypothetical protein [Deltaproteobacteria bacterium]
MALSGDVVLASAPEPGGRLLLLDRYPAAVVTILDRDTFRVLGQIGVGTGFAANPHDLLVPVPGQAWVTRYEANPSPGRMPCDGGDDVLRIDLDSGAVTGCTPLGLLADPGLRARPERFAAAEGRVWVTLGHLAEDFGSAGPGLVAGLDAATGELLDVVELPELANCAGLLPVPGRPLLAVSCTGLFAAGPEEQRAASGLALVDLATGPPAADLLL